MPIVHLIPLVCTVTYDDDETPVIEQKGGAKHSCMYCVSDILNAGRLDSADCEMKLIRLEVHEGDREYKEEKMNRQIPRDSMIDKIVDCTV